MGLCGSAQDNAGAQTDAKSSAEAARKAIAEAEMKPSMFKDENPASSDKTHEILENLFLGGFDSCCDKPGLQRNGVKYLLNCTAEIANRFPKDFVYKTVELRDELRADVSVYIEESIEFIEAAR